MLAFVTGFGILKTMQEPMYYKIEVFPDGFACPQCEGRHFHPTATILPNLNVRAKDPKAKGGMITLWVVRSECLKSGCNGFIDYTIHPDYPNGFGNEFRSIVEWNSNPLSLGLFKDFPRSIKS